MRVALISICETCDDAVHQPKALLPVADGTLAQYQMRLAIDSGAKKIIAFVQVVAGQIMRLQEYAESASAEFILVRDVSEIASHVAAEDDILVIADGLYVSSDVAASVWKDDKLGFATFSAGQDTDRMTGFERVDINHYWAGLAKLKGRDLLSLSSLPGDWSMESAALRSAVQQEYPRIMLSEKLLVDGSVALQSSAATISIAQKQAVFGKSQCASFCEKLLLKPLAKKIAPLIWRRPKGKVILATTQLAMLAAAVPAAYFGHSSIGFGLLLIALFASYLMWQIYSLFTTKRSPDYLKYVRLIAALFVVFIGLTNERIELPLYFAVFLSLQVTGSYWLFSKRDMREHIDLKGFFSDPYLLLLTGLVASIFGYLLFAVMGVVLMITMLLLIRRRQNHAQVEKITESQT